jgi:hypothetical protein
MELLQLASLAFLNIQSVMQRQRKWKKHTLLLYIFFSGHRFAVIPYAAFWKHPDGECSVLQGIDSALLSP